MKKVFYFYVASYFKFFAKLRLKRWSPRIIVVTGSNGKTTLLHMLEAQFGSKAKVSHHANSAYGVPFDILGLHRKSLKTSEWISLFLNAPLNLFTPLPKEKIYIVEADADRPHEGEFLAELLRPEVVLWVSIGRTHSMNFDQLVAGSKFETVEEAIALEYGYFLKYCQGLAVIDGDSVLQKAQSDRATAKVKAITKKECLKSYAVQKDGTTFVMKDGTYTFKGLLPEEIYLSIAMCQASVEHFGVEFDASFAKFTLPPGRGTLLNGKKHTILIDSSYNGNLGSIKAMLDMFEKYPAKRKWVVIGDMKELGKEEKEEHEALAKLLNAMDLERVILVGKIISKYTLPLIKKDLHAPGFETAPQVLSYLQDHIKGNETILFKGSQSVFLEGIIEHLLNNPEEIAKLPRQERFWKEKRRQLGFV